MESSDNAGFELICSVVANESIPVSKYKSKDTGISVFIADVEGPLVNGFFCLATEAHDDDGLPHTLEHLVFMGSEQYPYKGVLDLLANRSLASGTNAWTDTDHTCYTMTTAGSQGFLQLLPIYLDHILYPTITEAAYHTEVHHVNGEGEDAGVVYCEMQARENTADSLARLAMLRAMYPGDCGYKSETGGIMQNLRESTSHKKVVDYHKGFYRPENLCLIIAGQIKAEDVFQTMKPVISKIKSKGERPAFERPWMKPLPPLTESKDLTVTYPSDEVDSGLVYMAWRGPLAKDQYTMQCLTILMEYLCDSPIAPLQKEFVENTNAICSQISNMVFENMECCINICFRNVDMDCLNKIRPRTLAVMQKLVSKQEALDLKRMAVLVQKNILDALNGLEENPHGVVAFRIIGDFLYGNSKEELEERVNPIANMERIKQEKEEFWLALLKKYFLDGPCVTVMGQPSQQRVMEMGMEEEARVQHQREELGEAGLKAKQTELEAATEKNNVATPEDLLTSVKVPDVKSIQFHPISISSNLDLPTSANPEVKFKVQDMPCSFQLDNIHSNFVQLFAMLDTKSVPYEQRFYLPLLCPLLLESNLLKNGEVVPHEEVVARLEEDVLVHSTALGIQGSQFSCGDFDNLFTLCLRVELAKYQKGVQWLWDLLHCTQFSAERVKIVATRMANNIFSYRRRGQYIARTLLRDLIFSKESNHHFSSLFRQEKFLAKVLKEVDENPEKVVSDLEKLRKTVIQPQNWRVHMATNIDKLPTPELPWQQMDFPAAGAGDSSPKKLCPAEFVSSLERLAEQRVVVGLGAVESAYLMSCVSGIPSFQHPDLPAIRVFLQYLTQCEGPMWRQIRGMGLSYHYSMYEKPELGLLYLNLSRSTHIVSAYKEARDIVQGYCEGKLEFSPVELESCRSSLMYEIIESEKTTADASMESLLASLRGIPHTYNRELLERVAKVTLEDVRRVGSQYVLPLFDAARVRMAVVVNPSKVSEVLQDFKELGVELKEVPSLEESSFSECG